MTRVFNFSAGPAALPLEVLEQLRDEMLDWHGSGMSVMEMSHRGATYTAIARQAEADLRELMDIPSDYAVLFLQGGGSAQFSAVPLNLAATADTTVDYVDTGTWSSKAIAEARRYCRVNVVASAADTNYTTIPAESTWQRSPSPAYLHYTPNETIHGVEFPFIPAARDVPLVADLSSTILSRPIDVRRFGVIYAGAQKNIGPAGLVVVIVRRDLLGRARAVTPSMLDWNAMAKADSMLNTPATYSWYVAGLVFQWLKRQGGVEAMGRLNQAKAAKLYAAIDASGFYRNPVEPSCRSWMNVPFTLPDKALDQRFLEGAKRAGLAALAGHKSLGGMRASLYNAMPMAGVDTLIEYMREFQRTS